MKQFLALGFLVSAAATFGACSSTAQQHDQAVQSDVATPKPKPAKHYTTAQRQAAYQYWTRTVVPYGLAYAAFQDMAKQIQAQNMDGIKSDLAAVSKSAHLLKVEAGQGVPPGWSDVADSLSRSADQMYSSATAFQHGIDTQWVDQADQDTAKNDMSASGYSWKAAYDSAKDHFSEMGGNPKILPDFDDAAKGIQRLENGG